MPIDFRSDTVTQPTEEMRRAMMEAEVGDDVYGDDPTVNRLEALAAATLRKEAAVFMPTGTMGNQAAIMAHTHPGDEVIAGRFCHIVVNEAGGAARLSGVGCALTDTPTVSAEDIRRLIRPKGNYHYPRTRLVCLENALGNGGVVPLEMMKSAYEAAKDAGLMVHLDGARIFNAAAALRVSAADIAAFSDSVMFCVSKGLCAPVGSLVCGPAEFIDEVRRCRKLLGGGMRQAGVLAACGIIAIEKMSKRIGDDHENAKYLGQGLAALPGIAVNQEAIKINMVFWKAEDKDFNHAALVKFMKGNGIIISPPVGGVYRFAIHNGISRADVDKLCACFKEYLAGASV